MKKTFSQRIGLVGPPAVAQLGQVSPELRNELWNIFSQDLAAHEEFDYAIFAQAMWRYLLKRTIDSLPKEHRTLDGLDSAPFIKEIRHWFFRAQWNEVFDFIEFVSRTLSQLEPRLIEWINRALERENSGYRLISDCIVPIVSEAEVDSVREAIASGDAASLHIEAAVRLLADRASPDFRNAMKEAISAVEAIAKQASGSPKATLDSALNELEKRGALHAALKAAFGKLYGYSSDANGIRHALMDEPTLTQADARYFIVVCSAFTNLVRDAVLRAKVGP